FDISKLPSVYISADIAEQAKKGDNEARKKIVQLIAECGGKSDLTSDYVNLGYELSKIHVDVNIVDGYELDIEAYKRWREENKSAYFLLNADGKFICTSEIEKMSKRWYNVVNPDDIVAQYGAD